MSQSRDPRPSARRRPARPPASAGEARGNEGRPTELPLVADEEVETRRIRGYPARDLWTQVPSDATVPLAIPVANRARTFRPGDPHEPVRAAWIRFVTEERDIPEEEAARLWDSDPPLVGRDLFTAGFRSSARGWAEMERKLATEADDLRQMGRQVEALLTELEERYRDLQKVEDELAGARRGLRAASVIAAAASRPDVASDPDRLERIAAEVLADFSPRRFEPAEDEESAPEADAEAAEEPETEDGE